MLRNLKVFWGRIPGAIHFPSPYRTTSGKFCQINCACVTAPGFHPGRTGNRVLLWPGGPGTPCSSRLSCVLISPPYPFPIPFTHATTANAECFPLCRKMKRHFLIIPERNFPIKVGQPRPRGMTLTIFYSLPYISEEG